MPGIVGNVALIYEIRLAKWGPRPSSEQPWNVANPQSERYVRFLNKQSFLKTVPTSGSLVGAQ
jgi:hypothetical protein